MTALISIAMIGGFILIVFALAAFDVSARADSIAEQQQRHAESGGEWRSGAGGGEVFFQHDNGDAR